MNRRSFLKSAIGIPAAYWLGQGLGAVRFAFAQNRTRSKAAKIILARSEQLLGSDGRPREAACRAVLERSMAVLAGTSDGPSAWRKFFRADDVIGIKVNCLSGRSGSTHLELVRSIISGLESAGIPPGRIIVWDRSNRDLQRAGYPIVTEGDGAKFLGTDAAGGYEELPQESGSIGSCFSRIVSRKCSAIINVPVLKDHDIAGVTLGLKNFFGAIHNPNKYHDNNGDPYIADVNMHPYIRGKLRLTICDGLFGLYHGGPAVKPQWAWRHSGILLGTDPVALDRIGATIIEEKRRQESMPPLKEAGREPRYIATAARRGLGTDDPDDIEVVDVI